MKLSVKKRGIFFSGVLLFQLFSIALVDYAGADFASRFSLTLGEEYNDNIFFEKKKEHDFITSIRPTFSLLYAPTGHTTPIFTADLAPEGQIFARHSDETNFGDNITFNTGYTYYHSPRLAIHASDSLRRRATSRTGEFGGPGLPPPTSLPPPGGVVAQPSSRRLGDFISNGQELSNQFSLRGAYEYDQNLKLVAGYGLGFTSFLDEGGNEISHQIGVRGVYKWKEEHNLNFGYGVEIIKSRDGKYNVIHNIDGGDDFFSTIKIQLDPTLTITALSGIALNAGGNGPTIANRSNITVTKLWERATLNVGVNKGLTPSFGVAGISNTTSFFTNFNARLTELLTATANVDYSLFDTKDVNFNTFLASTGLKYQINSWLAANLQYSHRWEDNRSGAASTDLLSPGKVNGNNVSLNLTTSFDIWPNLGLARAPAVQ